MGLFSKKDRQARATADAASSAATDALHEIMAVKAQLESIQRHDALREDAENEEYQRQMREAELLAQQLMSDLTDEERAIAAENDASVAADLEDPNTGSQDPSGDDDGVDIEALAENIRNILNQVQGLDEATEEDMQELADMLAESMLNLTDDELKTIYDILTVTNPEFVELLKAAVNKAREESVTQTTAPLTETPTGIFWQKKAIELQTTLVEGQKSDPRMPVEEQEQLIKELSDAMIKAEL